MVAHANGFDGALTRAPRPRGKVRRHGLFDRAPPPADGGERLRPSFNNLRSATQMATGDRLNAPHATVFPICSPFVPDQGKIHARGKPRGPGSCDLPRRVRPRGSAAPDAALGPVSLTVPH